MVNKFNLLCLTSLVALGVASPVFQTINSNEFLPSYASFGYPEASNYINSEHFFTAEDYTIDGYSDVVSDLSELGLLNEYTSGIIAFEEQFINNDIKLFLYVIHVDVFRRGTNWLKFNYNGETFTKDLDLVSKIDKDEHSTYFKFLVKDFSPDKNDTRKYVVEQFKGKVFYSKFHAEEVTFTKGVKGDSNHLIKNSYYFHGNKAAELESVVESEAIIKITDKQVHFFCYGTGDKFLFYETDYPDTGSLFSKPSIYSDVWYCFFNTDHDYRMENLSKVKISYRQYDFVNYCFLGGPPRLDYVFTVNKLIEENNNQYKNKDYSYSYSDHTEIINAGSTEISTIDYQWFGVEKTTYRWTDDIIDLNDYDYSDTDRFAFENFKDKYRWGVHFGTTNKKITSLGAVGGEVSYYTCDGSLMDQVTLLELTYFDTILGKTLTSRVIDTPSDSNDNSGSHESPTPGDPTETNSWWDRLLKLLKKIGYAILGVLGIFLLAFVSVKLVRVITSLSNKSKIRRLDKEDRRKRNEERKKK